MGDAPEGSDFVDDGSVQWGDLTATIFGGFVLMVAIAIAEFLDLVSTGVRAYLETAGSVLGAFIGAPFDAGLSVVNTAWMSAEAALPAWGVLAFPVGVGITVGTLWLILWGVNRFAIRTR